MDNEIKAMFNAILEEMGRTEERIYAKMDSRFDKIEARLEYQCNMKSMPVNWKRIQSAC